MLYKNESKTMRKIIDAVSAQEIKRYEQNKKKALQLINSKVEPLERQYLSGKLDLDEFIKKLNPIQKQIEKFIPEIAIREHTFRFARPREMFATETLTRRVNNFEIPGTRQRLPDE